MRIFLDANILFSASLPTSATRQLFEGAFLLCDELVTNSHAIHEVRHNLLLKRPELLSEFELLIKKVSITNAFLVISEVKLPLQDIPILAGAAGSQCQYLWTGDKRHFGDTFGKTFHGVTIISGIQLADILIKAGWKLRD